MSPMYEQDHVHEVHEQRRIVDRRVVSPAQIVAGVIGLVLVIVGGVALARLGFGSWTGDTTSVVGITQTTLMALINIVAGVFFFAVAASPTARGSLIGLSLLSLAFGAIVAIEPTSFDSALGGESEIGILYIGIGVLGLLVALLFSTKVVDRTAVEEQGTAL